MRVEPRSLLHIALFFPGVNTDNLYGSQLGGAQAGPSWGHFPSWTEEQALAVKAAQDKAQDKVQGEGGSGTEVSVGMKGRRAIARASKAWG